MVKKGNLAVFEGSNISETKEITPTKIGVQLVYCTSAPSWHSVYYVSMLC